MKKILLMLALAACAQNSPVGEPDLTLEGGIVMGKDKLAVDMSSCLYKVHNRGKIPAWFVEDVIKVVKKTPDWVFAENSFDDIYTSIYPQLGPWKSLKHRKAAMVNVVLVAAGYESSWDYSEGRDMSASNTAACTEEAGILQSSGNSNYFSSTLSSYQKAICGNTTCDGFRACSKSGTSAFRKEFPVGHFMRLVRFTINHHGPLKRKEINPWLSKACVSAIEKRLD